MDRQKFSEQFQPGPRAVDVYVELGNVELRSHESDAAAVEVTSRHMDVHVQMKENTLYIHVEQRKGWRDASGLSKAKQPKAELLIELPADCQVHAKNVCGQLIIDDFDAPISTHVITGNTYLKDCDGPLDAKAVTGAIRYQGCLAPQNHQFHVTTGAVELALAKLPDARLDMAAGVGSIHCEYPVANASRSRYVTGDKLKGLLGSGDGRIKARTITGSVRLTAI